MSGQTLIERLRYIRGRAVEYVEWRKAGFPMTDERDTYPDDLYSAAVRAEAMVPLLDEVLAALSHPAVPLRLEACDAAASGGWCAHCGCGNDGLGYAHAPLCQRQALAELLDHCAKQGWWLESHAVKAMDRAREALAAAPSPAPAPEPATSDKWEGGEEWEPLAWQLCANECGEESCAELVWEGGPIPEPWGDRWLKYEDQAKEMIAMVRKHVPSIAGLPTDNQRTNHMSTNTEHTQGNCWYDSTTGVFLVDTTGRIIGDVQVRSDGAYAFHEKKLLGSYYTIGHAKEAVERAVSSSTKPSEDARDAARYRWLRDPANAYSPQWDAIIDAECVADALDALVDDGIAASLGGGLKGE